MAMSMPSYQPALKLGMHVEIVDTEVLGSSFGTFGERSWKSSSGTIVGLQHGYTNAIVGRQPYTLVTVEHRGISAEVRASHIRPLITEGELLIASLASS